MLKVLLIILNTLTISAHASSVTTSLMIGHSLHSLNYAKQALIDSDERKYCMWLSRSFGASRDVFRNTDHFFLGQQNNQLENKLKRVEELQSKYDYDYSRLFYGLWSDDHVICGTKGSSTLINNVGQSHLEQELDKLLLVIEALEKLQIILK